MSQLTEFVCLDCGRWNLRWKNVKVCKACGSKLTKTVPKYIPDKQVTQWISKSRRKIRRENENSIHSRLTHKSNKHKRL